MTKSLFAVMFAVVGVFALAAGCNKQVSEDDVEAARKEVNEELKETEQARQEANRKIQEKEQELDQERHEALKPLIEDAREKIRKEEEETREAIEELRATEDERARGEYVTQVTEKLQEADLRVEQLEERADDLEGVPQAEVERQIEEIKTVRKRVETELDDLKSADLADWKAHQNDVDRAVSDLNEKMGSPR